MIDEHWHKTSKITGGKWYRTMLVVAILVVVVSFGVFSFLQPSTAHAGYNPGKACNDSSVSIWLTYEPYGGKNWIVLSLPAHQCTNGGDAEGIWGKRCDSAGRCSYVGWKITGYTTTNVRDGYLSPVPPGRALFLKGFGQWLGSSIPAGWPVPSLSQINYDLR